MYQELRMKAKPLKTLRRKHEGRKYLPNIRFGDSVGEGVIQTWNLGDQQWPSSCCMIGGRGRREGGKEREGRQGEVVLREGTEAQ